MNNKMKEIFGEVIHTVTRQDLLDDGDLVDVTEKAKFMGFRYPVALTRVVWVGYVERQKHHVGDPEGRLHDILFLAFIAIKIANARGRDTSEVYFNIRLRARKVERLKIVVGPDDNGEPVLTIMEPNED